MISKNNSKYWSEKTRVYLHDPFDKALKIPGHEQRAEEILKIFGLDPLDKEEWKQADCLASGFDRAVLPGKKADKNSDGAVDFLKSPEISHPTGGRKVINFDLEKIDPKNVSAELIDFLKRNIGMAPGQKGLSELFRGDGEEFSQALFFYVHLVLRFMLAEKNIGGLGALWHRLPADTRIPDHSIWNHNALTSALYSCYTEAGRDWNHVGVAVYSLTPVQGFIAKSRKLRDYWLGSVILSWLAFEGICAVMEYLGPDHVLYPSLVDQPLVTEYLKTTWIQKGRRDLLPEMWKHRFSGMASFPNKFVALIPLNRADEIGQRIERRMRNAWENFGSGVLEKLISEAENARIDMDIDYLKKVFNRQMNGLWHIEWAGARLACADDVDELGRLVDKELLEPVICLAQTFSEILAKEYQGYQDSQRGVFYSVSHHLAQSALAAGKLRRKNRRASEPGEKCRLCGEFEVLAPEDCSNLKAKNYEEKISALWHCLGKSWGKDPDEDTDESESVRKSEKLCACCLCKRWLLEKDVLPDSHILRGLFAGNASFPSTAEMALNSYFQREEVPEGSQREMAQDLYQHARMPKNGTETDKYYALLVMDGDKMGKLVSGETLAADWNSVLHPQLSDKLTDPQFAENYVTHWKKLLGYGGSDCRLVKRMVTPAIHSAISEALADFAFYRVAPIVERAGGKLIYAGGDDVVAVMPLKTVLTAARDIAKSYRWSFSFLPAGKKESTELSGGVWKPEAGKLCLGLGKGEDISISGAVLICHYKEPLGLMIQRAHQLLTEEAKAECDRNALALEVLRRSGGPRRTAGKWDSPLWSAFDGLLREHCDLESLSTRLLYGLHMYEHGFNAILKGNGDVSNELENLLVHLIAATPYKGNRQKLAGQLKTLLFLFNKDTKTWSWRNKAGSRFDAPQLAVFLSGKGKEEKKND